MKQEYIIDINEQAGVYIDINERLNKKLNLNSITGKKVSITTGPNIYVGLRESTGDDFKSHTGPVNELPIILGKHITLHSPFPINTSITVTVLE